MRLLPTLLLSAVPALAAITNVTVSGTTSTQAVLSYTAPDSAACTLVVSESPTYSPLAHDLDPGLFSGANLDSRLGNITRGRERVFVIGKRAAEKAADGRFYSRALQAFTLHYYRIACGADTAAGTFATANIALGATYPEVYPVDPAMPGSYAWPNMNQARTVESIIDPLTGALVRRITGASSVIDNAFAGLPNLGAFDDSGSANPWRIRGSALPATYTANGTTPPKLYVPADLSSTTSTFRPVITADPPFYVNYVSVSVTARSTAKGEDAKLRLCLTIDGVTCAPGAANLQEAGFGGCLLGCTEEAASAHSSYLADWFGGGAPPFNTQDIAKRGDTVASYDNSTGELAWTRGHYFDRKWATGTRVWTGGAPYKLTGYKSTTSISLASGLGLDNPTVTGQSFGALIWKKTATAGAITISNITFQLGVSRGYTFWNAGYDRQCNPRAVPIAGEHGYYCQLYGDGLAWLGRNGTVRHLGSFWLPAQAADSHGNGRSGAPVSIGAYDPARAASFYGLISDRPNKYVVVRVSYTGDNSNAGSSYNSYTATFTGTVDNLTPGRYDLMALLARFDPRFKVSGRGGRLYCALVGQHGSKLLGRCYGGQDSPPAYAFVFDAAVVPSATRNPVIAMLDLINPGSPHPSPARWGVLHGADTANYPWFKIAFNNPSGPRTETTLARPLAATGNDVYVTGEPGGGDLDVARPGDLFQIGANRVDYEVFRITDIREPTHWIATRNYGAESQGQYAHPSGAIVAMKCSGSGKGPIAWNYIDDPHGLNASGNTVAQDDPYMVTGHAVWGPGNTFIRTADDKRCLSAVGNTECFQTRTGALPAALHQPPDTYIATRLSFAGVASPGYVTTAHPSQVQEDASPANARWFLDSRPMIFGAAYGGKVTKVASTGNLYKTTRAIHPKIVPTLAACGTHPLLDASPGPLTDAAADYWKYCVGSGCYPGALATETYVNCPGRTYPSGCNNSSQDANGDPTEDVCIGDATFGLGAPVIQTDAHRTDASGRTSRVLTYGFSRYRRQPEVYWANGKAVPDGSWATFATRWVDEQRSDLFEVKIPPYPDVDDVNRGTFLPLAVPIPSAPSGTDNVVVRFGYGPNFHCTSRQEACIANQSAINKTTPFYWASESYGGLACASGCTVTVPAIAGRVVYYQVEYRNSRGSVIATGPVRVVVE